MFSHPLPPMSCSFLDCTFLPEALALGFAFGSFVWSVFSMAGHPGALLEHAVGGGGSAWTLHPTVTPSLAALQFPELP